jgi:transposase
MHSTSENPVSKVYVGIDVHKRTFSVTVIGEQITKKKVTMPANPESLISFLINNYPGANIYSAYEAGFSGFPLHRKLVAAGIKNIVVNPASVETASNNRVKTDKKDSQKLAEHLFQGRLKGINIPSIEQEYKRLITRTREQILKQRVRIGNQIKSKLFQFGFIDSNNETIMSKKFLTSLSTLNLSSELKIVINCLSSTWIFLSERVKEIELELKNQAKKDVHIETVYQSVPGIGSISSRILANELGDMSQFKNEKSLFSFVGLTPTEHSSGENTRQGHISRQGSSRLRKILVECAWLNISKDPEMEQAFSKISARRGKKRAAVAVDRRLIGRIRSCFKNNTLYKINLSKEIKISENNL